MGGYKILIVEDEIIAAMALQETLERSGHTVTAVANTAQEALDALAVAVPDLVFMDINLEEKDDGIIIGKKILQQYKLPVIFITAYADHDTIAKAREVFPYGYIVKPWQERELMAVLETAIYKHLADQKTMELQETRNKFFSIIGHDLRSPLAALAVATRTLNKHIASLSVTDIKEFVQDIHHTVETLYAFTDNMLEWSKIQSGRLEVRAETLELSVVVEEVNQLLRAKAHQKAVALTFDVPADIWVFADKNMLRSVLLNLVSNGIKFCYPGGHVQLQVSNEAEHVLIIVSDNGVGMDKAHVEELLTFTAAIHTSGTQEEKGSGLGLLLCKEFVEANGGMLNISSEPQIGTTVCVTLPQGHH